MNELFSPAGLASQVLYLIQNPGGRGKGKWAKTRPPGVRTCESPGVARGMIRLGNVQLYDLKEKIQGCIFDLIL